MITSEESIIQCKMKFMKDSCYQSVSNVSSTFSLIAATFIFLLGVVCNFLVYWLKNFRNGLFVFYSDPIVMSCSYPVGGCKTLPGNPFYAHVV